MFYMSSQKRLNLLFTCKQFGPAEATDVCQVCVSV